MVFSLERPLLALALGAAVWGLLTRGAPQAWMLGALAIVAAFLAARVLHAAPAQPLRWRQLPRFAIFFMVESMKGGIDIATRALRPHMDLQPGFLDVPLRLEGDAARVLVALTVSLMPGSLAVQLHPAGLTVHVLDQRGPVADEVRRVEQEVARLFDASQPPPEAS
jgi:multicomponent Na+:H+ antiporter subunit E